MGRSSDKEAGLLSPRHPPPAPAPRFQEELDLLLREQRFNGSHLGTQHIYSHVLVLIK